MALEFKILDRFIDPPPRAKNKAYLTWDQWNDYSFLTLFGLIYMDQNSVRHDIGSVKIGYFGQEEGKRKLKKNDTFNTVDERHFSLGQDDSYYQNLNDLGEDVRDEILLGLRDIAKIPELYETAIEERVTKISLLRSISQTSVTGQFRRLAGGGARLTSYAFEFIPPKNRGSSSRIALSFQVEPESLPPSNIHILIGRNGVGKTHLINNMISSLIEPDSKSKYGSFISRELPDGERLFSNLISVTFSAFDDSQPQPERKDKTSGINYSYIGLKRLKVGSDKDLAPKSPTMLKNEFVKSVIACKIGSKVSRWKSALEMLESDPNFKEAQIAAIAEIDGEEEFESTASNIFGRLSSGHKIVLLTITRLVETLEERSLVLIDEPEAHLHPPLLSAFIRVLSELLINKNGVAIIATHSPVILQEVPKSCAWKLRRTGAESIAERPTIESFGENVGGLTREVFGLEVTNSGFYKMLNELVDDGRSYAEIINLFDGQLGMEGRAIVMALLSDKNNL